MPRDKVSLAVAHSLWGDALSVIERLGKDFPCPECDGSGQGNHASDPYPEPCPHCWGRGFQIPDE